MICNSLKHYGHESTFNMTIPSWGRSVFSFNFFFFFFHYIDQAWQVLETMFLKFQKFQKCVFSQVLFCFIFRLLIKHDTCLEAIFLIFNDVRNVTSWRFCCATCLEYWSSMASASKQYSYYLEIFLMHSLGGKVWLHGTIKNVKVSFFGSPWFKNDLWFCDTMFD